MQPMAVLDLGDLRGAGAGRPSMRLDAKTRPDGDLVLRNHGIARLVEQGNAPAAVARLYKLSRATVYRALRSVQPSPLERRDRAIASPN
jgi:DNA-binding CsgD family transcriptional regulator